MFARGSAWKVGSGAGISILNDCLVPGVDVSFKDSAPEADRPSSVSNLLSPGDSSWKASLVC